MPSDSTHDLQHLLAEAAFVRALAGTLAASDADDVAQETWLRAIESGSAVASPRAWLARVVRRVTGNLRRARRRRTEHERVVTLADPVPTSAELMLREERRRELVRVVDALPAAQRAVVLLRYFEDLPPRAIAARLGLPVTTVWNRLRDALQTLRRQLDERHGDRRAFLLPLLPAGRSVAAAGALALSIPGKVLGGATVAVLVLFGLWAGGLLPVAPVPDLPSPPPAAPMRADAGRDEPDAQPAAARTEVAPAPGSSATTGTLLVHAVHADGTPAVDLPLCTSPAASESRFAWRRARTDGEGLARFADLAPVEHHVYTNRNWRTWARAGVIAGGERHVELRLREGIRITGVVVDAAGVPVAGAEVHLTPSLGQRVDLRPAACADVDGRFELRSCTERCLVGARAAGHAPSWMQYVNLEEGGSIDLRLELPGPGGVVEGAVFGPDHAPLADAAIVIGAGLADIVRTTNEGAPAPPAYVYSAGDGRFRGVGLPPGDHPVEVHARGCGRWTSTCRVEAHAVTTIEVHLEGGFACRGVVLEADGTPAEGAEVSVGSRGRLGFAGTSTGADGAFRLVDLTPGEVEVHAYHANVRAATTVRGRPGETVACELRLAAGIDLRGRVFRGADEAAVGAWVTAVGDPDGARWTGAAEVDADGRFVLRGCPEGRRLTLHAGATGYRVASLQRVDPRAGDVVLRLEAAPPRSVRIRGSIVGPDGLALPQATVQADEGRGNGTGLVPASEGGIFEFGPLVPGRWRVCVQVPGQPWVWSEWRELAAEATWDLGEVRVPVAGTIAGRVEAPDDLDFHLVVLDAALALGNWGEVDRDGARFRSKPLAPGVHYVVAVGAGVAAAMVPADVRAGATSEVALTLTRGLRRRIEVHCDVALTELDWRVRRGGELVTGSAVAGRTPGTVGLVFDRWFAPGDYVVTARGNGRGGEARFTASEGGDEVVRVELR